MCGAKRDTIFCWSAAGCDRFDRCGALPRRPRHARPHADDAAVWAGRLDRHACRPCLAYLPDRFHGACGTNARARRWFESVRAILPVNEFIGSSPFAVHDRYRALVAPERRTWPDAKTIGRLDHFDMCAARGGRVGLARGARIRVRRPSAVPRSDRGGALAAPVQPIRFRHRSISTGVWRGGAPAAILRDKTTRPHRPQEFCQGRRPC